MKTLVVISVLLSGCSLMKLTKAPTALVTTPSGVTLEQHGDAAVPASVQSATTTTTVPQPMPSGTTVTISTLPQASTDAATKPAAPSAPVVVTTSHEQVTGPTAFTPPTPPPPPTPSQIADGRARFAFWCGLLIGTCAAIFGLVKDWNFVMYGGVAVGGACAFALFVQSHPIIFAVIGIGAGCAFFGPYMYHKYVKGKLSTTPTV